MPLPYPEIFERRELVENKNDIRKKYAVFCVIVLNYLHLNRPKTVANTLCRGQRLNARQWEVVRTVESYAEAWFNVSPIGPEEMGRTAQKVEGLEGLLRDLEISAEHLAHVPGSYFPVSRAREKKEVEDNEVIPSKIVGAAGSLSTFKPIESGRLKFVGRPSFDPGPFLDPLSKQIYEDPLKMRDPITKETPRPPRLRVHCSKLEKIKLFELLDSSDRLSLHLPDCVTPLYGSGLFAVTKSLEKDRMILDSRGANILERPPNRWIHSLSAGELLTRIVLSEDCRLTCSGNDLKDFYYFFKATKSRAQRNVLVGGLHPKDVAHLRAFKPEFLKSQCVYGGLNTLAMGDTQAVELAQACHLGLASRSEVVEAENLLSLQKPFPRTDDAVGLVMDDFVVVSKVKKESESKSSGAVLADKMLQGYKDVGLMPNEEKSFRDVEKATFWGADLDGGRGIVRGSLRRAVPTANLVLRMVSAGFGTAGLLQTLAGCVISLFLYRRRFLAVLDSLFEAYRGRDDKEVVKLDGRLKSDLLIVVGLLPLAATNVRASPPQVIYASDASNWGEAGVVASLGGRLGEEMLRHVLRKSIWVKLLSPSDAWLRGHGDLAAEDETPEEGYRAHPLWEILARSLNYRLVFAKRKTGQRHINIGELRGALRVERIAGLKKQSQRVIVGLDSQVALGCLIKGRSSSKALNAELWRSIPTMVGLDVFSDFVYFNTKSNPSDDPTRGCELRKADLPTPDWWEDVARGDFKKFDLWMAGLGLDDMSVAGLPPLSELGGYDQCFTGGILPQKKDGRTRGVSSAGKGLAPEVVAEEKQRLSEIQRLNEISEAERLPQQPLNEWTPPEEGLAISEDAEDRSREPKKKGPGTKNKICIENGQDEKKKDTEAETQRMQKGSERKKDTEDEIQRTQRRRDREKKRESEKKAAEEVQAIGPKRLSAEASRRLGAIPRDKFVLPAVAPFPPEYQGCLDLFSGERGVAKAAKKLGVWSLCYDIEHGADEDLTDEDLRQNLKELVELGCFGVLGGGLVCSSFSTAVCPAVRCRRWPRGKPNISENMRVKVREGNESAVWFFGLLEVGLRMNCQVWLENPASSWLFHLPEWTGLLKRWPQLGYWVVDYCRFNCPWRKRTRFANTTELQHYKTLCTRDHEHLILRGRSRKAEMNWTRVAQAYPDGVAEALALGLCVAASFVRYRAFDPASCARSKSLRIGEASNPGPRRGASFQRTGVLSEVQLVEAKTLNIQSKTWEGFYHWLATNLSPPAMESAFLQPALLVLMLEEYGNYLYKEGHSLFMYRHLVVYAQQNFLQARPFICRAWSMVARWERLEPTTHRIPLPLMVFKAMLGVSLAWNWKYFAGILVLGFWGIMRPSEPLGALRSDLVLPTDQLQPDVKVALLRIGKSKTSRRGMARVQHASIVEEEYVDFLEVLYRNFRRSERLNPISASAFRRRWDSIVGSLGIPLSLGLTPGCLRGGGCVATFQKEGDIMKLLWRMRLRQIDTLQNYLQEVTASTFLPYLPRTVRGNIERAAALGDALLHASINANAVSNC